MLSLGDVPYHLQFNRFILRGISKNLRKVYVNARNSNKTLRVGVILAYRPLMSFYQCIGSLLYLHNETINIYTHLIAFVVMCVYLPEVCCWQLTQVDTVQKLGHAVASTAAWGGSTLYHLLMPHNSGEQTYRKLLSFDVFCIWLSLVTGTANPLYVATHCYDRSIRLTVMAAYLVLNGMFLIRATRAKTAWDRATSFLFLLACRWSLYYMRAYHYSGGHKDTSSYMMQHDVISSIGVILSVFKMPERFSPGTFDLLLNSHNIMHLMCVVGALPMHRAVMRDFQWLEEGGGDEATCQMYEK